MKTRFEKSAQLVGGALLLTLTVTGCSAGGSGPGSPDTAASGDNATVVADAQANVDKYTSAEQEFPVPTEKFTPGSKAAVVISAAAFAPVVQTNAENAVAALETMGWTATGPLDGAGTPSVTGGLIDSAVQADADALVLVAVDPTASGDALKRALDTGMAITCVMCPEDTELADLGLMYATIDMEEQGEILGWQIIVQSEGTGTIVNTVDAASAASTRRATGVTKTISENCPNCTVLDDLTLPGINIGKPGPPEWTAFLSANPPGSVTNAVAYADVLGLPMSKTLTDTGRTDIALAGYDADDQVIALMKSGTGSYDATVAIPFAWASWAGVDLVARKVAGVPTWDAAHLPMRLVTTDTVDTFTEWAPQGDWRKEFATLWGVS